MPASEPWPWPFLALRVAARFQQRIADEGEEAPSKGGVPPRWQEWLDAVHQGGKAKVPNPNAETRDRYSEVAFSTALKDKDVFRKAMKEYHEWIKKNPEDKKGPSAPAKAEKTDEKPKPKSEEKKTPAKSKPVGMDPKGALVVTDKEVDETLAKHKAALDDLVTKMKKDVADYEKKFSARSDKDTPKVAKEAFAALSDSEKMLHVGGYMIGEYFEKQMKSDPKMLGLHNGLVMDWTDSSGQPPSDEIDGLMSSLGVEGYTLPKEEADAKDGRARGAKNEEMKKYVHEVLKFNRAVFKHLGLKEMTVFRGVNGQGADKAEPGDKLSIKTRELSSFSSDPSQATGFGTAFKSKVPVENIFWSYLTTPIMGSDANPKAKMNTDYTGEGELVIMGASALPGTCVGRGGKRK
jgi:hypothetical protein